MRATLPLHGNRRARTFAQISPRARLHRPGSIEGDAPAAEIERRRGLVMTVPFVAPVEPEVYWRKAMESGL